MLVVVAGGSAEVAAVGHHQHQHVRGPAAEDALIYKVPRFSCVGIAASGEKPLLSFVDDRLHSPADIRHIHRLRPESLGVSKLEVQAPETSQHESPKTLLGPKPSDYNLFWPLHHPLSTNVRNIRSKVCLRTSSL